VTTSPGFCETCCTAPAATGSVQQCWRTRRSQQWTENSAGLEEEFCITVKRHHAVSLTCISKPDWINV